MPIAGQGNAEPGAGAAEAVEQAIMAEGADTVAAIIAEPVMGAGGVIVPPPTYFPTLREICDRHDVLLIADEVITGFGRTGRWFALGHWGVEPDLVSFAKGVTSAYLPLGGVIASKQVHEAIESAPADRKFMHAATYSGHPACCAVGLRNVAIIEEESLVERAAVMGKRLLAGLEGLRDLPAVGDVRGLGMMCGVELVTDSGTKAPAVGLGPQSRARRWRAACCRASGPAAPTRRSATRSACAAADDPGRDPRPHPRDSTRGDRRRDPVDRDESLTPTISPDCGPRETLATELYFLPPPPSSGGEGRVRGWTNDRALRKSETPAWGGRMGARTIGSIVERATGRLGTTPHLRSLTAIRGEGGLMLGNGDGLVLEPRLLARNRQKLAALAAG